MKEGGIPVTLPAADGTMKVKKRMSAHESYPISTKKPCMQKIWGSMSGSSEE
jgi:hypothetical protein